MLRFHRTENMLKNLYRLQAEHDDETIAINGVKYSLINHNMTHFLDTDKPIASIGGNVDGREILIVKYDEQLQQQLSIIREKILHQREDGSVMATLKALNHVMKILFFYSSIEKVDFIGQFAIERGDYILNDVSQKVPVAKLSEFARLRTGVCRHHALANCFIIEDLIKHGILPAGEVRHHRQNVKRGAHAWNVYIEYASQGKRGAIYSIDTLNNFILPASSHAVQGTNPMDDAFGDHLILCLHNAYACFTYEKISGFLSTSAGSSHHTPSVEPRVQQQLQQLHQFQQLGVQDFRKNPADETDKLRILQAKNKEKYSAVSSTKRYQMFGLGVHGYVNGSRNLRDCQAVKSAKTPLLPVSFKEKKIRETREIIAEARYKNRH